MRAVQPTVVLALDGVLDASLGVAVDVLAAADRVLAALGRAPVFSARVVSVRRSVRLGSGLVLQTGARLLAAGRPAVVVVPGVNAISAQGLDAALGAPDVRLASRWVAAQHGRGALVAAGCTAVFLAAREGLLDGARATTAWMLGPLFRRSYPKVELELERTTICQRRVWTAGAALSMADLVLALVRRFAGADVMEQCLRYLALGTRPTQARYFVLDVLAAQTPELVRAERWARQNLERSFSISELARAAAVSPRTLARRVGEAFGTSPLRFVQRLKVEQAQHLLVTTSLSFDEVSARVGYADPSALRRVLRRETGGTARALRDEAARRRA